MRTVGDRDLLLRLCYDSAGRPSGVLSFLASQGGSEVGAEHARELYYRVTGQAFNALAPPYDQGAWSFTREFAFDEDQGGARVGGDFVTFTWRRRASTPRSPRPTPPPISNGPSRSATRAGGRTRPASSSSPRPARP